MRRLSLNKRLSLDAANTEEVDVFLFYITHPDLDAPLRLSTDPTERLSVDPLRYGTRSTWMDSNTVTEPFEFIIADALVPSDIAEAGADAQMAVKLVDDAMVEAMRSFQGKASVSMAHVLAASPSVIEGQWRGMLLNEGTLELTRAEIVFSFSRDDVEDEPHVADTFSKQNFPGLHR